jgi:hypothetical protein
MLYHQALRSYAATSDNAIVNDALLSSHERRVLRDIYYILRIPHRAQELLSYEHTPVASHAIPVYETLIAAWESLKSHFPHLSSSIDCGISKIREYIVTTRSSRITALCMGTCLSS